MPAHQILYEPGSDPPRVRNAFHMHVYNPAFLNLARTGHLTTVLEQILGSPLRLYASQMFAKPALVGSVVPAHQDMPYWPFEPPELVSAWIALDDSTVANGC